MTTLYIITGAMAAGKSTIAKELVQHFERSAHVGGDAFLRMIARVVLLWGQCLIARPSCSSTSGKTLPWTLCADSSGQDSPRSIKTF